MLNINQKNKFFNLLLIASLALISKSLLAMSIDEAKFKIPNYSISLVEKVARYIVTNKIDWQTEGDSQITQDLKDYMNKIQLIESRRMDARLKELFLSTVHHNSLESILKAAQVLDKLDQHFTQEESDLLKNVISSYPQTQILFKIDLYAAIILPLLQTLSSSILKSELEEIKKFYGDKIILNKDCLESRFILLIIYKFTNNIEEINKLLAIDTIPQEHPLYHLIVIMSSVDELKVESIKQILNSNDITFIDSIICNLYSKKELLKLLNPVEKEKVLQSVLQLKVRSLNDLDNRFKFVGDYMPLMHIYYIMGDKENAERIIKEALNLTTEIDFMTYSNLMLYYTMTNQPYKISKIIYEKSCYISELLSSISNKKLLIQD